MTDHPVVWFQAANARVDVQDDELIGFLLVEDLYGIEGIANVFPFLERHRFDERAFVDKQTWRNPRPKHRGWRSSLAAGLPSGDSSPDGTGRRRFGRGARRKRNRYRTTPLRRHRQDRHS